MSENAIKAYRTSLLLTQREVAEQAGVTVGCIHKWEKSNPLPIRALRFLRGIENASSRYTPVAVRKLAATAIKQQPDIPMAEKKRRMYAEAYKMPAGPNREQSLAQLDNIWEGIEL